MPSPIAITSDVSRSGASPAAPARPRIICAMSGGVDSAYAALLLQEQGYDVVGVHMATSKYAKDPNIGKRFNTCCSPRDSADARAVALGAGFAFYVMDLEREFHEAVIAPFVDDYLHGRTPNPCVLCNNRLKLGHLLDKAHTLGAEAVATGHYAITEFDPAFDQWVLRRPADRDKDQTYYLFGLTTLQVQHFRCPLGRMTKDEVRARSLAAGLDVHDKPDSQDICFVPDGNYRNFLHTAVPDAEARIRPGDIVTTDGRTIGRHTGTPHYTVGQRKGLGIAHSEPLYVVAIDTERNVVVAGTRDELGAPGLEAREINWQIAPQKFAPENFATDAAAASKPLRVRAQIRYRSEAWPAAVELDPAEPGAARVVFDDPVDSVTPGQAVVFYDAATGDTLLGGGWISRALEYEKAGGN